MLRRFGVRDRGEIGLLAAFIALAVGAALAGGMIEATAPAKSNPPAVFIRINEATVDRTPTDGLQVQIKYTSGVAPDPGGALWSPDSKIYCIASAGNAYGSGTTTTFVTPAMSRDDAMTIDIAYVSAQASTIAISCDVSRDGRSFHSAAVQLAVPPSKVGSPGGPVVPPSGSEKPGGVDASDYAGTYNVKAALTVGIELNCGPRSVSARIVVTPVSSTRIKVEITSNEVLNARTGFETDLAPTAQFSGELPSFGLLTGRFEDRSGTTWLTGQAVSPDHHCTWTVEGPRS